MAPPGLGTAVVLVTTAFLESLAWWLRMMMLWQKGRRAGHVIAGVGASDCSRSWPADPCALLTPLDAVDEESSKVVLAGVGTDEFVEEGTPSRSWL